jgi:hypothetical protein
MLPHPGLGHGLEVQVLVSIAGVKKVKPGNGSSAAKGNSAPKNVDEYLAGVPEPARSTLNKIRAAIRAI